MNENVRLEVLFHIRDARGLNAKEKAFLFVTETRGFMFGKWDTNAADMGLSKRGYYDARNSLLEKGLIREDRNYNDTTVYVVNADLFPYGEQDSHSGNTHSRMGNAHSRSDETKVTMKDTKKVTNKVTTTTSPDGPVVPNPSNYEVKEEAKTEEVLPLPLTTSSRHAAVEDTIQAKNEAKAAKAAAYMKAKREEEQAKTPHYEEW